MFIMGVISLGFWKVDLNLIDLLSNAPIMYLFRYEALPISSQILCILSCDLIT